MGEIKHYRESLYNEMRLRFHAVEVEGKLRLAKQAIREIAHEGFVMRADKLNSTRDPKTWRERACQIVKEYAGVPAEFNLAQSKLLN